MQRKDIFETIREYRILRTDILYPFDQKKCDDFPNEKIKIEANRIKLAQLIVELDEITKKNLKLCKNNLIECIEKILELITNNKLGYPLSRNQGLIFSNYIFGKVIGVLDSAINSGIGFSYPQFYLDKNGDFDATKLINLLLEFSSNLKKNEVSSFIELENLYNDYVAKIQELWKEENINHP